MGTTARQRALERRRPKVITRDEIILRLWPVPTACGDARRAIRQFCHARGVGHLADDAELLTSEVVSNAIRHATTLITVVGAKHDDVLVVSVVGDNSGHVDLTPQRVDDMAENGRGLVVLDSVADEWGCSPHYDGTTVWFRLS